MATTTPETTVLASTPDSGRWTNYNRSRIIEFYGFEGEDLRHFIHSLDSFFALNGLTHDYRKVAILRAQLRRVASVHFDKVLKERGTILQQISYAEAVKILQDRFISEAIIEAYQCAFDEMTQVQGGSPAEYLSRLYEAADSANIVDDKSIHSRFRAGLLSAIKVFCREQSATSFSEWVKHSNAWWNAHVTKTIELVDNPFLQVPNGNKDKNFDPIRIDDRTVITRDVNSQTLKSAAEAYASAMSPSISALTAKMEALELHSLIPGTDETGQAGSNVRRDKTVESLMSENGLKSFIKNIVQEVHDEKVNTRKPYREKRVYFNDEYEGRREPYEARSENLDYGDMSSQRERTPLNRQRNGQRYGSHYGRYNQGYEQRNQHHQSYDERDHPYQYHQRNGQRYHYDTVHRNAGHHDRIVDHNQASSSRQYDNDATKYVNNSYNNGYQGQGYNGSRPQRGNQYDPNTTANARKSTFVSDVKSKN